MLSSSTAGRGPQPRQRPTRVGLLLCGEVHNALQTRFGNYGHCLIRRLQLDHPGTSVRIWQAWKGDLPANVLEADAYLVSGSPASVFDREPWIARLEHFIRNAHRARRRLLGICFGHQMIHHALGGRVERASGWGLGAYPVHLYQPVAGLPDSGTVSIYAMHRDQVITPAPGFEHLAGSDFCPYYLMRHTNRVMTIQGHPEFTRDFFYRFLDVAENRFDANAVVQARSNIPDTDDSEATCRLLNHFLLASSETGREKCKNQGSL